MDYRLLFALMITASCVGSWLSGQIIIYALYKSDIIKLTKKHK